MTKRLSIIFLLAAVAGCSSAPSITELSSTADPAQEISRVDAAIKDADTKQVGVLSPKNFVMASDTLDRAREELSKNKDQKDILHDIALSEAYLKRANENAEISAKLLSQVVSNRQDALKAQAQNIFPKEFSSLDNDLKDVTKDVESNDTASATTSRDTLANRYSDIELQSIRQAKMGDARHIQEEASNEGARKLTPATWAWADKKISADDAAIVSDRHNVAAIDAAATDAKAAADRLLKIVRLAKNSASENPEELAAKLEKDQLNQERVEQKLGQTTNELDAKTGTAAALAEQNKSLEAKTALDRKFEEARNQFSDNEAEVYEQGDKLLLRLKGLSFPKDQSVITVNNYPLLSKVQKVIKSVGAGSILVEGHTDSTGPKKVNAKLSDDRAKAVESYLTANDFIGRDKITAKGYGDSKPLASNKTSTGRAQNRRVDVIITPEVVQE